MLKFILIYIFSISLFAVSEFQEQRIKIVDIFKNKATIQKANLIVGQSGVVVHKFEDNKSIILTKASVVSSDDKTSMIEFIDEDIFKQPYVANTNLTPQSNDIFILNYMYDVSLLIVPNFQSYNSVRKRYSNNFINSDLFAGYLKINEQPIPTKEDFTTFTKNNNISTIYIVINSKLYILDAITFKLLKTIKLNIDDKKFQSPFYTNIQQIEKSVFDFSSDDKIEDYDKYYLRLIGANK
jgi:hypothetical protein